MHDIAVAVPRSQVTTATSGAGETQSKESWCQESTFTARTQDSGLNLTADPIGEQQQKQPTVIHSSLFKCNNNLRFNCTITFIDSGAVHFLGHQ